MNELKKMSFKGGKTGGSVAGLIIGPPNNNFLSKAAGHHYIHNLNKVKPFEEYSHYLQRQNDG